MLTASVAVATCLLLAESPANTWPGFRGTGDNISAAQQVPLEWSPEQNVAWTAQLAGHGQSSPVVYGGQVYVTSVDGDNKESLLVSAYALADGKLLWQRRVESSVPEKRTPYVSYAAPTPCADEYGIYAFFESGDLLALDHAGEIRWQRSLTDEYGKIEGNHGLGASLAQAGGRLVLLVDHAGPSYLLTIDKDTGENAWKVDRQPRVSWSSPLVAGQRVLISSGGVVQAYALADGKLLWQASGLEGNTVPSPAATAELLVIGSSAPGNNLALPLAGEGDVKLEAAAWVLRQATSSFASPLIYQGRVYLVSRAGVAACLKLDSGEELWTARLSSSCWATPLGVADRVYFFSNDGTTTVMAASDEAKKLAENRLPTESRVYGVAAVEGNLLVREEQKLTCLSARE